MSNTRKNRKPFAAEVQRTPRGGVMSVHRFGDSGQWGPGSSADVVYVGELIGDGLQRPDALCCSDCDSIATGLRSRPGGPYEMAGITHSPGCPWLTEAARTWKRPA